MLIYKKQRLDMKCNIQDILEIDLPDSMADSVDIFNNEWAADWPSLGDEQLY